MFNLEFLHAIRRAEFATLAGTLPPAPARVLEIGAGTGQQALLFTAAGYEVVAVDVAASNYRDAQVFPIQDFDGQLLPFPDGSFDVVYSSNVLEHVRNLAPLLRESKRVLAPGGRGIHLIPTPAWRLWTTLTAIPTAPQRSWAALRNGDGSVLGRTVRAVLLLGTAVVQRRHGERGNAMSELWHFRASRWRRELRQGGLDVVDDHPTGIFYTGNMLAGPKLTMSRRIALSKTLGSACRTFVVSAT